MTIPIKDTFRKSWELTKKHFLFFAALLILACIGGGISGDGKGVLSFVLQLIVGTVITIAFIRATLDTIDGKSPSIDSITSELKHFPAYLAGQFLFQIALIVGFVLLIIPGVYVAVTYNWYAYLIAEKRYGAMEALKQSSVLVEGARWELLRFFLAVIGLNILGALALLVGLFVTVPISMIASAMVYRMLVARVVVPTPLVDTPPPAPPAPLA
jgi:uncharacterized membrane protein